MEKVTIILSDGRQIRLGLNRDAAPVTVENFIELCKDGFYKGLIFHRVIPNFMIQGGGYAMADGELSEKKAARPIKGEFASNKCDNPIKHVPGTVSMARTMDKDSASSQFFICVAECAYLDGEYAAFGQTLDQESLAVVVDISKVKTGRWMSFDDVPAEPVVIKDIIVG